MSNITIPPSALEAGKDTAFAWLRSFMEDDVRVQNMTDEELGELVEAACRAMLRAWPGSFRSHAILKPNIVLPLPQESGNE